MIGMLITGFGARLTAILPLLGAFVVGFLINIFDDLVDMAIALKDGEWSAEEQVQSMQRRRNRRARLLKSVPFFTVAPLPTLRQVFHVYRSNRLK